MGKNARFFWLVVRKSFRHLHSILIRVSDTELFVQKHQFPEPFLVWPTVINNTFYLSEFLSNVLSYTTTSLYSLDRKVLIGYGSNEHFSYEQPPHEIRIIMAAKACQGCENRRDDTSYEQPCYLLPYDSKQSFCDICHIS